MPDGASRVARPRLPGAKRLSAVVVAALMCAACGYDSSPSTPSPVAAPPAPAPSPAPSPPPAPAQAQFTLTSNGASPVEVTIAAGGRVTFVNNDVIPHDIFGGPDPAHPDCPEIDAVGFLAPGERRQTLAFPQPRVCQFHDHSFHSDRFTGRIVIQ